MIRRESNFSSLTCIPSNGFLLDLGSLLLGFKTKSQLLTRDSQARRYATSQKAIRSTAKYNDVKAKMKQLMAQPATRRVRRLLLEELLWARTAFRHGILPPESKVEERSTDKSVSTISFPRLLQHPHHLHLMPTMALI